MIIIKPWLLISKNIKKIRLYKLECYITCQKDFFLNLYDILVTYYAYCIISFVSRNEVTICPAAGLGPQITKRPAVKLFSKF